VGILPAKLIEQGRYEDTVEIENIFNMAIREFEEPITLLCLYKSVLLRGQCLLNNKDRDFRLS
jgi:hypothetical protein